MNTEQNYQNSTEASNDGNTVLPAVKELACWIYYEDSSPFYCFDCVEKRMEEINKNREFADEINYEGGDTCGYWQDYADTEGSHEAECCQCHKPLFTLGFD